MMNGDWDWDWDVSWDGDMGGDGEWEVLTEKIPHTGDIESLDRCGSQDRYNFGENA